MKIAFLNRGRETHMGGDLVALDATMDALRRKGVECEETGWDVERLKSGRFDLAHIVHCNFDWSFGNYNAVRSTPDHKRGLMESPDLSYVLTPCYYPGLWSGITKDQVSTIVKDARMVLPFSKREGEEMRSELGWFPYEVIPNGTDPKFHCTTPLSEREGVLCVSARGTEDKGIPQMREACEKLGIPFTCATGVSHDQLPAIYAKHRVFVNNSDSERMSLTTGEALCAGCFVMSHEGNRGNEHYGSWLKMFSKFSKDNLSYAYWFLAPAATPRDLEPNNIARALTWDAVADRLIDVYKWVCR